MPSTKTNLTAEKHPKTLQKCIINKFYYILCINVKNSISGNGCTHDWRYHIFALRKQKPKCGHTSIKIAIFSLVHFFLKSIEQIQYSNIYQVWPVRSENGNYYLTIAHSYMTYIKARTKGSQFHGNLYLKFVQLIIKFCSPKNSKFHRKFIKFTNLSVLAIFDT